MSQDNWPENSAAPASAGAGEKDPASGEAGGQIIYIAGDDGNYYRITDADLKSSFLVKADDPNLAKLDLLTGQGVSYSGIDARQALELRRQKRFTDAGMWGKNFRSLHFINLRVLMSSMPEGCAADEEPPADPTWDPNKDAG